MLHDWIFYLFYSYQQFSEANKGNKVSEDWNILIQKLILLIWSMILKISNRNYKIKDNIAINTTKIVAENAGLNKI